MLQQIMSIADKFRKWFSPSGVLDSIFFLIMNQKERNERVFYTIHRRPNKSSDIVVAPIEYNSNEAIAIVMQGPITINDDFTLQTTILYKKYFPSTMLILSTWVGEDKNTIEQIIQNGWTVIQNPKPSLVGHHNINLQLASSKSGIETAKKLGAKYVLKTRTDQRIYNPNALQLFLNFDKLYPPQPNSGQTRRLIVPNIDTLKYRPYGIGDMLMFGHINDMQLYWGARHDARLINLGQRYYTVLELAQLRIGEVYICTEYLQALGLNLVWTLNDTWQIYGKYFCIFDHSLLDLFWYKKYEIHTEYKFHYYHTVHSYQVMLYSDWIGCYENTYNPRTLPEPLLNEQEGGSLSYNT